MSLTATTSAVIRKTADAAFVKSWESHLATVDLGRFVSTFNSDASRADFGWFGSIPFPSQWASARSHRSLKSYTDTLTPVWWELTVDWDVDAFEDDQTGTASNTAAGIAARSKEHVNSRLSYVIMEGDGSTHDTAYDGQFYFDDDHAESGTNQDNDLTSAASTGTDPTAAEFEAAFGDALEALAGFTDDQGNPLGLPGGVEVVIPPEYMKVAGIVLGSNGTTAASTTDPGMSDTTSISGIFRGQYKVTMNPYLTDADRFYLFMPATADSVGPFIQVSRHDWVFNTFDPTNDSLCNENRIVSFRAEAKYEFGYGLWQKGIVHIFS